MVSSTNVAVEDASASISDSVAGVSSTNLCGRLLISSSFYSRNFEEACRLVASNIFI